MGFVKDFVFGGSSPDPTPYNPGQQQEFNKEDFRYATRGNNPNVVTPYGDTRFTGTPGETDYTKTTSYKGDAKDTIDSQLGAGANRAEVAEHISGQLEGQLGEPVDYSGFQPYGELGDYDERRQNAEDSAYDRATGRLDPQWKNNEENLEVQLRNQGLRPGDEAYDDAKANFLRGRNDAYSVAQDESVRQGREESNLAFGQQLGTADYDNSLRGQQINEELRRRGWSINEINALLEGTAVQDPVTQQGNQRIGSVDLLGGAELAQQGALDKANYREQRRQTTGQLLAGFFV